MSAQKRKRGSSRPQVSDDADAAGPSTATALPSIYDKEFGGDKAQRFASATEVHRALSTTSADALRSALQQLRFQLSLKLSEEQDPTLIPAADERIQLVTDFCSLCQLESGGTATTSAALKPIFAAWELAHKQNLVPLLPLPLFVLGYILPLLSAHFPNQSFGENIINRLLSPSEPWWGYIQAYIANASRTTTFTQQGKGKDGTGRTPEVTTIAALRLLREMVSFGRGRFATKVFELFNWGTKSLPNLYNMRRKANKDKGKEKENDKSKRKGKEPVKASESGVSMRRPDIRILYILFILSFLQQSYSSSIKIQLLDLGRDHLPAMLKGLVYDAPDVVHHVLVHLHEDLVRDKKVPRAKKVHFLNEWACEHIIKLYARQDERTSIEGGETADGPSVAELAHHFLLSISTNPGFGICYADRGWYPRNAADGTELQQPEEAGKKASTLIYNKVALGILRHLGPTDDMQQQELALGILRACPELVRPYLESQCGGLTVEPRPSSKWLCNAAFVRRVIALELPSFKNAKLERIENSASHSSAFYDSFASQPPPIATILSNTLPSPLSRQLFTRGINHQDRLVRHTTAILLCTCLERLSRYRQVCDKVSAELDEDDNGAWRLQGRALEIEARKRLPEIAIVIQMMQNLTSTDKAEESNGNVLLMEVSLRLLWLYYLSVPSLAFDSRFDVGKLLTNSFMAPLSRVTLDEKGEPEKLSLQALCQVHALRIVSLSTEHSFDWTAKTVSGAGKSYLGLLLTVYVTTPLEQVRASCEELFERLVAPSTLFEHDPSELAAWLSSLPNTDANTSVISADTEAKPDPLDTLSSEQSLVLGFFDECVQRCMKTSYRYIESARQFHSSEGLVASPLLMTMFEQFTIRAKKGLFEPKEETTDALLAFFSRLMPSLCGSGRPIEALKTMASQIAQSVEDGRYGANVLVASLNAMQQAPQPDDDHEMDGEDSAFKDAMTPADLRTALRATPRPLVRAQVKTLHEKAAVLKRAGHVGALQILEELHPVFENVSLIIGEAFLEAKLGQLPLCHLVAGQDLPKETEVSPFVENLDELDDWTSPVKVKLAASMAIERLGATSGDESQLSQTISILRRVVGSSILSEAELEQLVFASPTLLACLDQTNSRLLAEVADLALEVLDSASTFHRRLMAPLSSRLLSAVAGGKADNHALKALQKLASFLGEEGTVQAVDSFSRLLEKEASLSVIETLAVCVTLCPAPATAKALAPRLELLSRLAVEHQSDAPFVSVILNLLDRTLETHKRPVASFDITPLTSLAADGLLVKLVVSSRENASKIALTLSQSEGVVRHAHSLRASLEVLLETGVGKEAWTEDKLSQLGKVVAESLSGAEEEIYPLCTALSLAYKVAKKEGYGTAVSAIVSSVLEPLTTMHPRETFKEGTLLLVIALNYPAVTQQMLDQGLLWLVRRFAEDANDSVHLVHLIELFTALVSSGVGTIKPHLADPVVQAALKNRMLGASHMKLILALCKRCAFKTPQLSRYLSSILAHNEVTAILNATAALTPPDGAAEEAQEDEEGETDSAGKEHRLTLVRTVHAIASQDAPSLLNMPLITKLLSVYKATMSVADRTLLDTFRMFEASCYSSFLSLTRHWASPSSSLTIDALSEQNRVLQALLSLDASKAFATCANFPRDISMRRSLRSDSEDIYDPVFIVSLLSGVLVEQKLTGLHWLGILRTNVLGVVVCGLSSRCEDMRSACLSLLGKCYASISQISLSEKEYLLLTLDLLRNTSPTSLPLTTTLFVASTLRSLSSPAHFTYPMMQKFLLQRPTFDATDLPLLYNMLFSSSDNFRRERRWMLTFLRDVSRAGGRAEWKVFKRRHVWALLASLYDSVSANLTGVRGEVEVKEDQLILDLVEETMTALAQNKGVATELVVRRGALTWVATHKNLLPLAENLLRHADLEKLTKSTDGAWVSTALSMLSGPSDVSIATSILELVIRHTPPSLRGAVSSTIDRLSQLPLDAASSSRLFNSILLFGSSSQLTRAFARTLPKVDARNYLIHVL